MGRLKNPQIIQFDDIYSGKRVLVTGHTGFKGSWLSLWLSKLGATVIGYSLPPPTKPNHFELLNLPIISITGDIRDRKTLNKVFQTYEPEVVFHLAAQPLVRRSYEDPVETFETNVIGTLNVFEACRKTPSVKAIVNVTSDKCYENREWFWGYREIDPMGGHDPYSASKGCAELLTNSYRRSFFNSEAYGKTHNTLLASVRAGNVIGGGDWAEDRLVPDLMRSASREEKISIRSPMAIRPWQHVLEPLSGYLLLGQKLLESGIEFADAWNFGPSEKDCVSVINVVQKIQSMWERVSFSVSEGNLTLHEARLLKLDCSKARMILKWMPVWDFDTAIQKTIEWYKSFYENSDILSEQNLTDYTKDALSKNMVWIKSLKDENLQ